MTLITHRILTQHQGENATTPHSPIAVALAVSEDGRYVTHDKGVADLRKQVSRCIAWDFDMPTLIEEFGLTDVTLPEWLSPAEWLRNTATWKWLWGFGADGEWPESWQRGLLRLENVQRYAAIKLLKTKSFKSAFRQSLRDQIVAWLETPPEARTHRTPLSPKQWLSITGHGLDREARHRDIGLYNAKGFRDARKVM